MSVRVIARIRPLLGKEEDSDIIVKTDGTSITIPNPKKERENFTFQFNCVLDRDADQAKVFTEVSSTIKHLFKGNDVTIFAYGVTGTGKTHTMRGGKAVAERGIIPRLLSAVYRRGKEMEKKSEGQVAITVDMSYYEIYNDKVFDLFEPPEKRSLAGLPLREHDKKTIVVGLTEKRISSLKEFEALYDTANANRTTFATKLNAHSSRSHAIMGVRIVIENKQTGEAKQGTMSCIDLAGSEDNRRTCNDRERMTESASINKSLFVLAQCVEAISKKQARVPYRESKMTRILSLGQNNGMTVMILNIAPTKAYHQDTLSSLNFANRTKKIEIKEVENPTFKIPPAPIENNELMQRQPLRPLSNTSTGGVNKQLTSSKEKPLNKPKPLTSQPLKKTQPLQNKASNINVPRKQGSSGVLKSEKEISELVEKKVEQILAQRALEGKSESDKSVKDISEQVNRRLEELEKRMNSKQTDARAEGLSYLLLAKQHKSRGEDIAALKMYELALPFFPNNAKLLQKIASLKASRGRTSNSSLDNVDSRSESLHRPTKKLKKTFAVFADESQPPESQICLKVIHSEEDPFEIPPSRPTSLMDTSTSTTTSTNNNPTILNPSKPLPAGQKRKKAFMVYQEADDELLGETINTPRTHRLLAIINSEDVQQIKLLKGVGPKRAETLAQRVKERKEMNEGNGLASLKELAGLPGIGQKIVDTMRNGVGEQAKLPTQKRSSKGMGEKEVLDVPMSGMGLGGESGYESDEYVPTPRRRRSRTVMSKKEAYSEAFRDFMEARMAV